MDNLLLILIVGFLLYMGYRIAKRKMQEKKALKLGRSHIHVNFPDYEGEHQFDIHMSGHKNYKDNGTPKANEYLIMKRDPDNEYDIDAIQFLNLQGYLVGWMPSNYNKDIAKRMDNDEHFYGRVRKSIPRAGEREIVVSIFTSEL